MKFLTLPEPLDSLLRIEPGAVTSFFGGPGTGKTNFCILAALDCIKNGGDVVFLDTESGFSPERFKQVNRRLETGLSRIKIVGPKDFSDQGRIIRGMDRMAAGLIIVDSLVALYRLEYTEAKSGDGKVMAASRELSKQLSVLSNLARDKGIPVIITAHTFKNWDTKEHDVIGGNTLKHWCKAMVFLERTGRMSERKATLTKHLHMAEGQSVKFQIVQDGIKPAGFRFF